MTMLIRSDIPVPGVPGYASPAASSVSYEVDPIDLVEAEKAAGDLLATLGQHIDSGGMTETPRRMAQAYAELLTPGTFDLTTFANAEGYDELVLVQDMSLRGVRAAETRTVTSTLVGTLRADPSSRAEFLSLARSRRQGR